MRAQFIQIPVELLDDPAISAVEFRLYSILLRYGLEGNGFSQAGTTLLSKKLKCCQQTVTRSLKNLAAAGYISIERIGLNRNNRIRCRRTVKRNKSNANRISQKPSIKTNEECIAPHCSDINYKKDRRPTLQNPINSTAKRNLKRFSTLLPPNEPVDTASPSSQADSRVVEERFSQAQERFEQAIADNLRPASLHWFQNAVVVEDQADNVRISLGNDHVEWVESQYLDLLNRVVGKNVCLIS